MRLLISFLLLVVSSPLWGDERNEPVSNTRSETQPVPLVRVSTAYDLEPGRIYPSCAMFKQRRLQREKVLRELKHTLDKQDKAVLALHKDSFVTNQYFLDESLWRDDLVVVTNVWMLPAELVVEFQNDPQKVYLWLVGDGVDWREHVKFFPDTVSFAYDPTKKLLVSTHRAYYVDYCSEHEESRLNWYPQKHLSSVPTELDAGYEELSSQEEACHLPISSMIEIKMILNMKGS